MNDFDERRNTKIGGAKFYSLWPALHHLLFLLLAVYEPVCLVFLLGVAAGKAQS